ncbi:hypothetical protein QQS21_001235 [Conoideocrella luteorostrata]|uniref:NACHT domain-containing protein n=1 Tax=Conoideocrella luteorostrata TaxID=1105319 RepID=A0AAJ0CYE1_9HYPO|nr:hypothetical protein QQS21_001235 [Conoideocrella luteorostrata]
MATVPNPVPAAFTSAVLEFKNKLKDDELYDDILKTDSIDKVYAMTDSLQEEQARRGRLQRLAKIQPYIERLRGYEGVLDTFVQVKPDILALIWGPIKLLIQWASVLPKSLDALVETIAEIGQLLPEFKDMTIMFNQNKQLLGLLVLFFQDILDFYFVALKFFGMSRWRFFFESVWPKQRDKIKIVMSHIERHTILMRDEVRLEHIREEHDSKQQALEHFDRTQRHNQHQEYNIIKTNISPKSYDNILDRIRGRTCKGTGTWLLEDETFKVWLDITDSSPRKTFLCGTAITKAMTSCRTVFAFLSHIHSSSTSALSVLHSLIFQIASENESLQEVLCQSGRDGLKNNLDVAAALLQTILLCAGPACIAIDGLDEIEERERERLLYQLIDISKACPESRILISSRPEDDISKILGAVSSTIRVDNHNAGGIQTYVNSRTREWLKHNDIFPEYRDEIRRLLAPVATKAKGMFLYAQIMLSSISLLSDIEEIRNELRVLPESLDQAYGRIFRRINSFQSPAAKKKCRSLLGWISCSPTPMTIQELEQALVVSSNPDDGFRVSSSLNVVRLCGPIVEVVDNYVQFVHFTVQEYINSPHTDGFIDITEATLSLATCCIRYLCQNHHDVEVDEENFENNILSGCYRLHYFASDTWLELVAEYLSRNGSEPPSPDLTSALESLNQKRSGWILGSPAHLDELWELWYHPHLNRMEQHREDLFSLLRNTAYFRQKCDTSQFHIIDCE